MIGGVDVQFVNPPILNCKVISKQLGDVASLLGTTPRLLLSNLQAPPAEHFFPILEGIGALASNSHFKFSYPPFVTLFMRLQGSATQCRTLSVLR